MTSAVLNIEEFKFVSRGIGQNWLPCFLCGHQPKFKCQADCSFFVDATLVHILNADEKTAIHPIMSWFHAQDILAGKLDYRSFEPNRVQVKLGACGEHEPNLLLLSMLCVMNDNKITKAILNSVIPTRKRP